MRASDVSIAKCRATRCTWTWDNAAKCNKRQDLVLFSGLGAVRAVLCCQVLVTLIFCLVLLALPCILPPKPSRMTTHTVTRHYWIFTADPHHYHWDTLFVKGKEMWHGAGAKPDAVRALKQVRKGDRVLCYHSAPDRSLYSIAEVTR